MLKSIGSLRCIRNYSSTRRYNYNSKPRRNNQTVPGLDRNLKHFKEDADRIVEDPEGFGDLESDLMDVHKSHSQYEREAAAERERIKLLTVKNKYFKEYQPNFLTYSEKQQIKLLHSQDPNEWTPEKLSESFPATPDAILKVIKANWVARTEKRIRSHDEACLKNWGLYKEGKLDLSDELKEHLDKFTVRSPEDINSLKLDKIQRLELPKPKVNEFSSIITSCKKFQNAPSMIEGPENDENDRPAMEHLNTRCPGEDETFLLSKVQDRRPMRFQDLDFVKAAQKENLKKDITSQNVKADEIEEIVNSNCIPDKFEAKEMVVSEEDIKKYEMSTIKDRIHIPRKLWKKGTTYKVEDCFYDDDGRFLYRVPGMTGNIRGQH